MQRKFTAQKSGDVAIIGMACVFPKAPDLQTYWQNILSKVDAIVDPPPDHLTSQVYDPASKVNDRIYCKRGGYLSELPLFNPADFGIMPVAVEGALPEQFMALKVAHEALVDAGFPEKPFNRDLTEVILGRGTFINRGYVTLLQHSLVVDQTISLLSELHPEHTGEELAVIKARLKASLPPFIPETAPGIVDSLVASIIANRLDLKGRAFMVDAACASFMVALEIALQDLRSRQCDAVLTGAVQISTPHPIHLVFTQLGALSRHPNLRPFDKDADGTMLGEGIGMMVLKRREDAERDGHRIYALIKGVGSSSDGRGKGLLAPLVEGEELAFKRAYQAAGVNPNTIGLIEAHGTAMPLGDVTEIQALTRVFGTRNGRAPSCALGSVKSMIGHLLPASGVAGAIKAALALYYKILPPTLHCDVPNPNLELEKTPFYINTEVRPWIHGDVNAPRRAGVNAFGFGGINAHAVLEEYGAGGVGGNRPWDVELCVFQGDSRQDLMAQGKQVLKYLSTSPSIDLLDLAFTLNSQLGEKPYRLAIVASSLEDLKKKLGHAVERLSDPKSHRIKDRSGIFFFEEPMARQGKLAFLFPGEGSQYVDMLADLCLDFPVIRSCFDLIDRAYGVYPGGNLPSHFIFPPFTSNAPERRFAEEKLWQMDYAVDAVITADRALFRLFRLLEIHPDAIMGHSSGELMALEAAGAFQVADDHELIQHIVAGNRMIQRFHAAEAIPEALLIAVGVADRQVISNIVKKHEGKLFIAMENCPNQMVICSSKDIVDSAVEEIRSTGAICQILPFQRPYHTPLFEPASQYLEEFLDGIKVISPEVEIFSCMTAAPMPKSPQEIRRLAIGQWTSRVRFQETIESMYQAGIRLFLEVGPKANLTSFVTDILKGKPHLAVAANVHHRSGITQLNHTLGLLTAHGVSLRLDPLYSQRNPRKLDLVGFSETLPHGQARPKGLRLSLALPTLNLGEKGLEGLQTEPAAHQIPTASEMDKPAPEKMGSSRLAEAGAWPLQAKANQAKGRSASAGRSPGVALPGGDPQPQVMKEYLHTMDQFLQVQEEVIQAYIGLNAAGKATIPVSDIQRLEAAPEVPGQFAAAAAIPAEVQSDQPNGGCPAFSPVAEKLSVPPIVHLTREIISELLLSLVSAKTGYPLDLLNLDQDLEADLGIDSIKRVEILGALRDKLVLQDLDEMDQLSKLKTLQHIIDCFAAKIPGGQAEAAALSGAQGAAISMPLIGEIISLVPGVELTALREFDLDEDIFLLDHAEGRTISFTDPELRGLPLMPFTMSMEIMAQAAALLSPEKLLTGMKDIRGYRFIQFKGRRLTLRVEAVRQGDGEIRVQIRHANDSTSGPAVGLPIFEGSMIFGDKYPDPPDLKKFSLKGRRPSSQTQERLYSEDMVLGPCFQGVASVDWWGEDGLEATLQVLPFSGFLKSNPDPRFITDPVLLDAAGQLVAYWVSEHPDHCNVYPFMVEALQLYGPNLPASLRVKSRARIQNAAKHQLTSHIDVLGPDGKLHLRLTGWADRMFRLPDNFRRLRFSPQEAILSTAWPAPLAQFHGGEGLECRRLEDYPDNLLHGHGNVWRHALAHYALNRRERELWQGLPESGKRRTEWLLARIAGKDAVRMFLKNRYGLELCLPDIEIASDEYGRPLVHGSWTKEIRRVPSLSLAHTRGLGVALLSEESEGCGIDVETLDLRREGIDQFALTPEERDLVTSQVSNFDLEWVLRIWCAKEAAGKALGRGLPGGPRDLTVRGVEVDSGAVELEVSGRLVRAFPQLRGKRLKAQTMREGDLLVATLILQRRASDK